MIGTSGCIRILNHLITPYTWVEVIDCDEVRNAEKRGILEVQSIPLEDFADLPKVANKVEATLTPDLPTKPTKRVKR